MVKMVKCGTFQIGVKCWIIRKKKIVAWILYIINKVHFPPRRKSCIVHLCSVILSRRSQWRLFSWSHLHHVNQTIPSWWPRPYLPSPARTPRVYHPACQERGRAWARQPVACVPFHAVRRLIKVFTILFSWCRWRTGSRWCWAPNLPLKGFLRRATSKKTLNSYMWNILTSS